MRIACLFVVISGFALGLPAAAQSPDSQPRAADESAPPAPVGEANPANLLPGPGNFDMSALSSLLGQLLSQGPQRPLPAPNTATSQADPSAPAARNNEQPVTPQAGTRGYAPYNPGFMPHHHPPLSRQAFHDRVYAKRMALVNRIRAAAESSGNEQMAAQATQLEVLVNKVHQEGLGGLVQMLGQLQAARQSENAAPTTPPAVVPEEDLGEAAPLTFDDAPPAKEPADTAPPKPQPDGEPEAPPALPLPENTQP